ncbi:hypothetical protein [Methylobacterium sp. Gmos1]
MGGPTPPYARTAADISDSTASGRSVLTGTPAQGATALGLGTANSPTFTNATFSGGVLDVGWTDGTAGTVAFNFHSGATAIAYDTRIVSDAGNGTLGGGSFTYLAANNFYSGNVLTDGPSMGLSGNANRGAIYLKALAGTPSGFMEFWRKGASARDGYIGYSTGTTIDLAAEVGYFNFIGNPPKLPSFTVAALPAAGIAGRMAWASNGRAYNGAGTLQAAGAGTGVHVSDDGTAWRVVGTNQTVQA